MPEAFIIDAGRTPVTRRGAGLAAAHENRYGLVTICVGGGQANVTIIERP